MITAVDLFCGAGGLSIGLERAGIQVRAGFDVNEECKGVFERNTSASFIGADVGELDGARVSQQLKSGDITVLAGCAPCQPFSSYGRTRRGTDDRWRLLKSYARLVRETRPDVVTMENVPGLPKHSVFDEFVLHLREAGYSVVWDIFDCTKLGVPQTRDRLVMIATRRGVGEPQLPRLDLDNDKKTVRDAIGHLPEIAAGETHPGDRLHTASSLSDKNLSRIRASRPGGSWRDWPENLVAECHLRDSGKSYPSVYGRMSWDEPSPTITTQCFGFGNGRFGHPEQDRAISLREAALLQSFPEDWQLFRKNEPIRIKFAGMMIGNAVPPKLGEAIGEAILRSVGFKDCTQHAA